jgi:hypothetical protein
LWNGERVRLKTLTGNLGLQIDSTRAGNIVHKLKHLRWLWIGLIIGVFLTLGLISVYQSNSLSVALSEPAMRFDEEKTNRYMANFDPLRYETLGSDYDNPVFSPENQGISLDQIDNTYDYDFERLSKTEAFLKGVDRPRVLKYIFEMVTDGLSNDKEKHLAVLRFLDKSSYHNVIWQPMYPDQVMVTDPLVLLELHEMRCGHIARVAADLFDAAGYPTRLVQLSGHIVAEIFYEGDWHYFDADVFGGGETVLDYEGDIPSVAELSRTNKGYLIDSLAAVYYEVITKPRVNGPRYPSYYYFSKNAYSGSTWPTYYIKTATVKESNNYLYGWNYFDTVVAKDIVLTDSPDYYEPGAVSFTSIQIDHEQDLAYIEWSPSVDKDNDLLGYYVFISSSSRGWDYLNFGGEKELLSFWNAAENNDWDPQMYDNLFKLPPHEIDLIKTEGTSAQFSIKKGSTYYVSVMPYDAHGESVGKKLYPMSNEIKLSLDD